MDTCRNNPVASQMGEKIGEFTEFEHFQARFSSSPNLQEKAGFRRANGGVIKAANIWKRNLCSLHQKSEWVKISSILQHLPNICVACCFSRW